MCIPGLHISLGIFDRLWELLEDACNEIDISIVKQREVHDTGTFGVYAKALNEVLELREKIKLLHQHAEVIGDMLAYLLLHLPNPANDPIVRQAHNEVSDHDWLITTTV